MGRSALIVLLLFTSVLFAQTGYVDYNNPVHDFLERMDARQIIRYDNFERPVSRNALAKYLKEIRVLESRLSEVEKNMLRDFETEFAYELGNTEKKYVSLLGGDEAEDIFSEKEKHLYYYSDSSFGLFVDLHAYAEYVADDRDRTTFLAALGGGIRGNITDLIGFEIKAENGVYSGNKNLAFTKKELKYNYKFNYWKQDDPNSKFFDKTSGYLSYQSDYFAVRLGRDRLTMGRGINPMLLSDYIPPSDYLAFNAGYSFFGFTYIHGKLLGVEAFPGYINGFEYKDAIEKHFVYHRMDFDLSRHLIFGIGETIIYSKRGLDLSYLNPMNFYKSIEHSNRDRDNAVLFFDLKNNTFRDITFDILVMIDDIDFGKLGTSWIGNKFLLKGGMSYYGCFHEKPFSVRVYATRISPYFYSHSVYENNFASYGISFNGYQPNSGIISLDLDFRLHHRFGFGILGEYIVHGANETDGNGNIEVNRGGDINLGFREGDSDYTGFLDGYKVYYRRISLQAVYEPVNNFVLTLYANYERKNGMNNFYSDYMRGGINFNLKL